MKKLSLFPLILTLFAAGALDAQTATVSVDKTSLSFSAQAGSTTVQSQQLTVNNAGSSSFAAFSNASWLKFSAGGSANQSAVTVPPGVTTITVTADPTGLLPKVYTDTITITGASGAPASVAVTFSVGTVGVTPSSLAFAYQINGTFPAPATLTLSAARTTTVGVAATTTSGGSWLTVPQTATAPGTVSVALNPSFVGAFSTPGTYNGTVTITPPSGPAATVAVTLTITAAPTVAVTPSPISLKYQINGATGATNNPSTTVTLTNPGAQKLNFLILTTSSPVPWLTANPASGEIPANDSVPVTVAATTSGLTASPYTGALAISIPLASNPTINVPVSLLVSNLPLLNVPKTAVAFTYQSGAGAPAPQNVLPTSSSADASAPASQQMALTISKSEGANWLTVPSTGITGMNIQVGVNPAGLAVGRYDATVTVTGFGAGNGPQTFPVTLTVSNDPLIVASFGGCSTQSTGCPMNFPIQIGQNSPTTQNLTVTSSTGAPASFTATTSMDASTACGTSWLSSGVTTAQVGTTATFPITVSPGSIASGTTCTGKITISGTNPNTGAALPNSPAIQVTMYVSSSPMLVVSPGELNFNVAPNATAFQTLTVTSTNPSAAPLSFAATTTGVPWLFATSTTLTTAPGQNVISVGVSPSGGLAPGTYTTEITITAADSTVLDSPVTVPVTLTVTSATMSATPASLSFSQIKGAPAPDAKTVSVATSSTDINFTVSVTTTKGTGWLSATASSTTATSASPATVTVKVDGSSLAPDTYQGSVTITSMSLFTTNSPITIPVTLEVKPGTITATPTTTLTFNQVQGGTPPQAQTIAVASTPGPLAFTVTTATTGGSGNWLSVDTPTGTTPATGSAAVKVSVNGAGLGPNTYSGTVTIASPGATGSPITIPVQLVVSSPQSFTVSPAAVNFTYVAGSSSTPATQTVTVTTGAAVPFTTSVSSNAPWLSATPASGAGTTAITISINPAGLMAGDYTGTIAINSTAAATNPAASITVNLHVQAVPKPVLNAVANAASYVTGAVSPGENIVFFGTGLGPASLTLGAVVNGAFATTVSDTQVFFDDTPAPILYTRADQTSVMVPYGVAGRATTNIRIVYKGVQSNPSTYQVVSAAPGIYTLNQAGSGQGAILNQDYSVNGSATPAAKGSVVAVYMTGEGVTSPAGQDGAIAPVNGTGLFKPTQNVTATIGGVPAQVMYYGSAPGIVYGVMQVNVLIPAGAASGNQTLVINVGNNATQANVIVAVQ